jgi:hypothetical protein
MFEMGAKRNPKFTGQSLDGETTLGIAQKRAVIQKNFKSELPRSEHGAHLEELITESATQFDDSDTHWPYAW